MHKNYSYLYSGQASPDQLSWEALGNVRQVHQLSGAVSGLHLPLRRAQNSLQLSRSPRVSRKCLFQGPMPYKFYFYFGFSLQVTESS